MTRVLLLGGYGGFGARIAHRLAAEGWDVLVAGRNLNKAERFCAGRTNLTPLALDRDRDLVAALAQHRPFALIDAAGPFQGASYDVACASIAAGCHYVDIADGRDFVANIGSLDSEARAANVAVISGASSVPALSGAVIRALAYNMADIRAVEMAISASNRATAGPSVTRAIFSYIGRPIRLWRGGCWTTGHGWQDMRRETFDVASIAPLRKRLVALADVPDLELLPARLPDRPAVTFRAGTEMAVFNCALWLASWPIRIGLLKRLDAFIPFILDVQQIASRLGSDRSGMIVRLFGIVDGQRVERRWTLIASDGTGPEIPGLAAPRVLRQIKQGTITAGARDAGTLLTLEDFEPAFASLSIRHETRDIAQPPPLYARVLGASFKKLPPHVRAIHDVLRDKGVTGRATVTRGVNPLARMIATLFRFPRAGEHDLHVSFDEHNGVETWTRDFSGRCFRSHLSQEGPYLVERFGPLRFGFALEADDNGLTMHIRRWWLGPVPLPLALAPRSRAREWEADGRFHFEVPIVLPLIGLVVFYRGWLQSRVAAD